MYAYSPNTHHNPTLTLPMSRYRYKYAAGMLQARFDLRISIRALIARLHASNSMTVPEPHLVKRLLDEKKIPSDIFAVLEPYLWDRLDYELTCVMGEYKSMEELSKRAMPIRSHYIQIISILRNTILVALDDGNADVFKYIMGSTSAAWDNLQADGIGFKAFRLLGDLEQFAPLLAHLVCYLGKAGDPKWMGPALKSYSECFARAAYMSMGSGPIQEIKNTLIEGNGVGWCLDLLRQAVPGDRNPDVISFLANSVDWVLIIRVFFTKNRSDAEAIRALEATMRKIVETKVARWACDSVVFLVKRAKWNGDRIRFLEKALLKTVQSQDLDDNAMSFLEELFS